MEKHPAIFMRLLCFKNRNILKKYIYIEIENINVPL